MTPQQHRLRRLNDDSGLTLIEMVVAIGVLMAVLLSSLSVFVTAQQSQQVAEGTDRAIQLANSRLERIRQQEFKNIGFYDNTFTTYAAAATKTDAVDGTARTTVADYATMNISATETAAGSNSKVSIGATDPNTAAATIPNQIRPYEVTTSARNKFYIYTTITWARSSTTPPIAPVTVPATNGVPARTYGIKRVRVTVLWQTNGSGSNHKTVSETWIAPQGFEEAPSLVPVFPES